jgi:hypothetical protein
MEIDDYPLINKRKSQRNTYIFNLEKKKMMSSVGFYILFNILEKSSFILPTT